MRPAVDREFAHPAEICAPHALGSRIFVSYAKQDEAAEDEVAGQGRGFVDVYDTAGNLLQRVGQHGQLNALWGLALAPASFGGFAGDLLVGDFGDGEINFYEDLGDGQFGHRGELRGADGKPLAIDGLWALEFRRGVVGEDVCQIGPGFEHSYVAAPLVELAIRSAEKPRGKSTVRGHSERVIRARDDIDWHPRRFVRTQSAHSRAPSGRVVVRLFRDNLSLPLAPATGGKREGRAGERFALA
jgi:hypothetical protein